MFSKHKFTEADLRNDEKMKIMLNMSPDLYERCLAGMLAAAKPRVWTAFAPQNDKVVAAVADALLDGEKAVLHSMKSERNLKQLSRLLRISHILDSTNRVEYPTSGAPELEPQRPETPRDVPCARG